jgi:hypothetical protein
MATANTMATAFASAPAFAQGIPGNSSNGAVLAIHHHRHHAGARPLYNSTSKQKQKTPSGPAPGQSPNNGGM